MNKRAWIFVLAIAALVNPAAGVADLNNPNLILGHAAYTARNCGDAITYLSKFLEEDKEFLKSDPDYRTQIENAVRYCKDRLIADLLRNEISRTRQIGGKGHVNPGGSLSGDGFEGAGDGIDLQQLDQSQQRSIQIQ